MVNVYEYEKGPLLFMAFILSQLADAAGLFSINFWEGKTILPTLPSTEVGGDYLAVLGK